MLEDIFSGIQKWHEFHCFSKKQDLYRAKNKFLFRLNFRRNSENFTENISAELFAAKILVANVLHF